MRGLIRRVRLDLTRLGFVRNEKRMAAWILLLGLRSVLRRVLGAKPPVHDAAAVRMVSVLSMPRTGSTLAKRYLGAFQAVEIAPLQDFEKSLEQARSGSAILFDKKTDNIKRLHQIIPATRGEVAFVCLVRDPRDELLSLSEIDRHRPVPRDARFWPYWVHRYTRVLKVLRRLRAFGIPAALVRYEDLAMRPVDVKRAFLAWMGLDAEAVDEAYEAVADDEAVSRREDWKAHQHSRVHSSSVGRYRSAEGEIAKAISAFTQYPPASRLMKKLGYNENGPPHSAVSPRVLGPLTALPNTHTPAPSSR
jgi:hypothetical protein